MAENSKELLKLEANYATVSSAACLESKLFVCKKDRSFSASGALPQKPTMPHLPKSQVLGKVQDFLGVISESNKKLLQDAKENPDSCDIEVLSGNESKYIELDLMLGIADLHTPEAVAAAESAISGRHQPFPLSESSSGSDDEDNSDDDGTTKDKIDEQNNNNKDCSGSVELKLNDAETDSSRTETKKRKLIKRPKIVVLP
ncbi:hypothetical protein ACS0TY_012433 [Phlomoides rotata]